MALDRVLHGKRPLRTVAEVVAWRKAAARRLTAVKDARVEAKVRELVRWRRDHPALFPATGGIETHDEVLLRLLDEARNANGDRGGE